MEYELEINGNNLLSILDKAYENPIYKTLKSKRAVIYGAGEICQKLLQQLCDFTPPVDICFITDRDSKKKGMKLHNIEVIPITDIENVNDYCYIIAIENVYSAVNTLRKNGVEEANIIYPKERMCFIMGEAGGFNRYHSYISAIDMVQNRQKYIEMYELLSDEKSKKIFLTLLLYRLTGDIYQEYDLFNRDATYFSRTKLMDNESFVDVGAYIGDSIIEFLERTHGTYSSIIAIEADKRRADDLESQFENLHDFTVYKCGVGRHKETIEFDGMQMVESGTSVEVRTLDDILEKERVSIIKMDIESMERDALEGCRKVIKSQKPLLAICVYHLTNDIWYLGLLIHEILPEYKFYLEQPITSSLSETVLYAYIPNSGR